VSVYSRLTISLAVDTNFFVSFSDKTRIAVGLILNVDSLIVVNTEAITVGYKEDTLALNIC